MSVIVTVGIDLAKNVFAAHGVDATDKLMLVRPNASRAKLLEFMAMLPLLGWHGSLFGCPAQRCPCCCVRSGAKRGGGHCLRK